MLNQENLKTKNISVRRRLKANFRLRSAKFILFFHQELECLSLTSNDFLSFHPNFHFEIPLYSIFFCHYFFSLEVLKISFCTDFFTCVITSWIFLRIKKPLSIYLWNMWISEKSLQIIFYWRMQWETSQDRHVNAGIYREYLNNLCNQWVLTYSLLRYGRKRFSFLFSY